MFSAFTYGVQLLPFDKNILLYMAIAFWIIAAYQFARAWKIKAGQDIDG
jgi:hypothetical protein